MKPTADVHLYVQARPMMTKNLEYQWKRTDQPITVIYFLHLATHYNRLDY